MKALQQNIARLEGSDTQVLRVSMDSPFSNFAFAQQNGVSFPILGDCGGPVTSRYGLTATLSLKTLRDVADMRRCQNVVHRSEGVRGRQRLSVEYVDCRAGDLLGLQHADQS